MIDIDGAVGEGGGQILRTSLSLALCTGQPVRIQRIRARRPKPGLMRQHLACVKAALAISPGAEAQGAELGATELTFVPAPVQPGAQEFDVGSAGSCALVLQTVLPPLMVARGPSMLVLRGGTHNPMAPPVHFIERCFAPLLARLGVGLELNLRRLGFYPAGGGEFSATIVPPPQGLTPFDVVERGPLREAYAECLAPGLPRRVVERELHSLGQQLGWSRDALRAPATRQNEGPGNALMATLASEHATEVITAFGEKGLSSEQVAQQVARAVEAHLRSPAALGAHLADQWMIPIALAVLQARRTASFSCTEMTDHAQTNIGVIEAFLPVKFTVTRRGAEDWWVQVRSLD